MSCKNENSRIVETSSQEQVDSDSINMLNQIFEQFHKELNQNWPKYGSNQYLYAFEETNLFQRPDSVGFIIQQINIGDSVRLIRYQLFKSTMKYYFVETTKADFGKNLGFVSADNFIEKPMICGDFLYFVKQTNSKFDSILNDYSLPYTQIYKYSKSENRFVDSISLNAYLDEYRIIENLALNNVNVGFEIAYHSGSCGSGGQSRIVFDTKNGLKEVLTTDYWGEYNDDWGQTEVWLPVFRKNSQQVFHGTRYNSVVKEYVELKYPEDLDVPIKELIIQYKETYLVKHKNGVVLFDKDDEAIYQKPKIIKSYYRWDGDKLILVRKEND